MVIVRLVLSTAVGVDVGGSIASSSAALTNRSIAMFSAGMPA
jgi:hypothetical protein